MTESKGSGGPAILFYSYSHKDEKLLGKLLTALAALRREGAIQEWHDRRLTPGDEWREAIGENLAAANIILLLVSPDFIASDFCWSVEVAQALERHRAGKARVIPIILRPTDWTGTPFRQLQSLPKDARPVTLWPRQDSAWLDVTRGIRKAVQELRTQVFPAEETTGTASPLTEAAPAAAPSTARPFEAPARPESTRAQPRRQRRVYDAGGQEHLPGRLVRQEGQPGTGDPAADEAYDALGVAYDFLWNAYGRDSIDGKGLPLEASVHYGRHFANAFWVGKQVVAGDGDDQLANRFTAVDVICKQVMNGLVQTSSKLVYWGQAGALFNALAIVFAILARQYARNQLAAQSDWTFGSGLFTPRVNGRGLASLSAPGTAYNDPVLGRDPQPAHMRDYVVTKDDNAGIHINSGIPAHAFFRLAIALGGHAWEKAGRIWYEALQDPRLKSDATFAGFARLTVLKAERLFSKKSPEAAATRESWSQVGVHFTKLKSSRSGRAAASVSSKVRRSSGNGPRWAKARARR